MKNNLNATIFCKIRIERIKNVFIGILVLSIIVLFIIPIIIISQSKQKVTYEGNLSENPLQHIYDANDFGLNVNEMKLTTDDGLKVWVSEVLTPNPKGIIIYLTGIRQPSVTYFYGHSKWMKDEGYASILLEVRGHGNSEGEEVCLGYKEVLDTKAVVDYIKGQEKYDNLPIIVHGVSMGGAVAINSFGSLKDIDGLIAMSAYSSFEDVVYDTMIEYNIPSFICEIEKLITSFYLTLVFGDEFKDMRPINQIGNMDNRPALLIACTGDSEVQAENMHRLLKVASSNCEWWLRDSWEHFIIKDCDFINMEQDKEYCDRILEFISTVTQQ
ncbi:alpha/beta hydrolase [Vallitalea okinawensis]|uniref:alpha/beta hydrolase n=1 Tax=Vallitalea okinawensis TaxID=2078660 RepID=UPI000CFBFC7F|nr:alpha/beta hydrolase [Vallitalea okinawensis]